MSKKKEKDSWSSKSASEIIEEVGSVANETKERSKLVPHIPKTLSLRAFIKLLRKDRTLKDLDRLKVYNAEREPITQVSEISTGLVIS